MIQDNPAFSEADHRLALQCSSPEGIRQYDVFPPGATIGAWHGADIQLQDLSGADIAPLQAAVRFDSARSRWTVIRLSHNGTLHVDDTALACGQAHPISGQANLRFSPDCEISLCEDPDAPLPIVFTPAPVAEVKPAPEPEPAPLPVTRTEPEPAVDLFADLLGSGVVPVGAPPSLDTRHPFDMDSEADRNSHDPLQQLKPAPDLSLQENHDPLANLGKKSWEPSASPYLTDGSVSLFGNTPELPASNTKQPSVLDSLSEAYTSRSTANNVTSPRTRADHRPAINLPVRVQSPSYTGTNDTAANSGWMNDTSY